MYKQIILAGGSQLAKKCLAILQEHGPTAYLDTDKLKKAELMQSLAPISVPTLIFSIMNPYIFTSQVIANPNLTIVNLHHGILPGHRGRNAQAWALFCEETEAGITWHLVDEGVDTGKILRIERIPIAEHDTALSLMKKQNLLVPETLKLLLPQLLANAIPQSDPTDTTLPGTDGTAHDFLHLNRDVPNDGILDLNWSGHKMSCFLRAMDFGILRVLGTPVLRWQGSSWSFSGYRIETSEQSRTLAVAQEGDNIVIEKDHYLITLRKVRNQDITN